MRILYLAPRPPFPPEDRECVRPYHQLRQIALRHDVDLICFSGDVEEGKARERLMNICHRVLMVPLDSPARSPVSVRNLFTRRPLAFRRYFRKELLLRLENIAAQNRYEVVFAYSAAMAPYLAAFPGVPRILDLVEVNSLRWLEQSKLARFPASAIYRAEAGRLMKLELEGATLAHRILFASEAEACRFRMISDERDSIAALKSPVNPRATVKGHWASEPTIIFNGNLDHFPNQDAARHLLREVFPRIRKLCRTVKLVIAGANPPADLVELAAKSGSRVFPEARDLSYLFRDAWLAVAPHRISNGVRNEVLEAMALGVPVVATEAAASGLDLTPGKDLSVLNSPARFAAEVVRLLDDPAKLEALGSRGRRAVHNNYSHWSTAIRLEELVSEAALAGVGITEPNDASAATP